MESKFRCAVFDLDGTLFSSHETIYATTIKTFEELGLKVSIPREKFFELIGLHFTDMFDALGIKNYNFEEFISIYKPKYFEFIDLSKPYPYALETIDALRKEGIKIGLLTTKAQGQAEKILAHFGLTEKFDAIMGRRPGVANKPSAEPLQIVMHELNCRDASKCLMIGDSVLDVQCGKAAGTKTAAVTFGYGKKEDLAKENPDFLIDSLAELIEIAKNGEVKK
jgi:HAD superfamily hydrolase (TIGR01549 family)